MDHALKRRFKLKADVDVTVYDGWLSALELRFRQKQHLRDADRVDSRWVCCAWPCCDRWNVHWARMSGVAYTRGVLGYEYDAPDREYDHGTNRYEYDDETNTWNVHWARTSTEDQTDSYFGVRDGRDGATFCEAATAASC